VFIHNRINETLTLTLIAQALSVSKGYLSTLFKKETGKTLTQFIKEARIKHAVRLLRTTNLQVQTISQHCGIFDVQYFTKQFKQITGKSPSQYRG
jgi:YesN/AraC family two-component response regulator